MENEIIEALNRNTASLHQLIAIVNDLVKQKGAKPGWLSHHKAMEELEMSRSTLYRFRLSHPELCDKLMSTWYYNVEIIKMFKGKV